MTWYTTDDARRDAERQAVTREQDRIRAAVNAENEACAVLVEDMVRMVDGADCAAAIRARVTP